VEKPIKEFPGKDWTVFGLNKLLIKLRNTGSTRRPQGSGRPHSAPTDDNIYSVNELLSIPEGRPTAKSNRTTRKISRETGIHHSSVYRIVRQNLKKRRACARTHCC